MPSICVRSALAAASAVSVLAAGGSPGRVGGGGGGWGATQWSTHRTSVTVFSGANDIGAGCNNASNGVAVAATPDAAPTCLLVADKLWARLASLCDTGADERGEALKAHCERLLRNAEARIEKITLGADGKPAGTEPLDLDR